MSLIVPFFVSELFKDDYHIKNRYIIKKFQVSNNIYCEHLTDMHPVEAIKETRKLSVKEIRSFFSNNENKMID